MVIWTEPAKTDLRSIHDFIKHDSRYYAKKVIQDIRQKVDGLEKHPRIGKKVIEMDNELIRELSLYSYRIIYETNNETIYILAVIHKRRNFVADNIGT